MVSIGGEPDLHFLSLFQAAKYVKHSILLYFQMNGDMRLI
jgi:hypothetical protein